MTHTTHWSMRSIEAALGELLLHTRGDSGAAFTNITTDTRELAPGSVFVALKGERFDGHAFAGDAEKKGAGLVIVEHEVAVKCPQIIVRDTLEAYGALAAAWRAQFSVPVICVAGSNGKATTTQMIAAILRTALGEEHVHATRGNFNNDVGVPKTLLGMSARTKAAVIEAGISHPGEMARLAGWIRPTAVVLTNAQREHQEFLDGVMGSARENAFALVALSAKGTAVLPAKDGAFDLWRAYARARGCRVVTYGEGEGDFWVAARETDAALTLRLADRRETFEVNFVGAHAAHDAAASAAVALAVGVDAAHIVRALAAFKPVAGRGVRHRLSSGCVLIDDAYNANPDSMRAAVDVLAQMPAPRILVAGDMAETGENSRAFHAEIGAYARERGIERLLATGDEMRAAVEAFGPSARHFDTLEALIEAARGARASAGTLLVKASHSQHLTRVVEALVEDDKH